MSSTKAIINASGAKFAQPVPRRPTNRLTVQWVMGLGMYCKQISKFHTLLKGMAPTTTMQSIQNELFKHLSTIAGIAYAASLQLARSNPSYPYSAISETYNFSRSISCQEPTAFEACSAFPSTRGFEYYT